LCRAGGVVVLTIEMLRLHGRQGRRVLQRQVADGGEIKSAAIWSQTWRVSRSGQRGVVWGG
jgi:hypothetical protein